MNIRVENLVKRYGAQTAVDHISFEVKPGEILGFLGPNGAGKTTTMKMITNCLSIGGGDIFMGGKSVKKEGASLRKFIGYLPEHNPLYDEMTVMDYLAFCAAIQNVPKKEIEARVRKMIVVCGLDPEKHKNIAELSKGYRQRVGLAQAMIHDPLVLVLDEPTTGLDPNQIVEIRKLIRELGKEKTVILSTHILPEVEATCDRILIISKGKIVADGTAESLRGQVAGQEILTLRVEDVNPQMVLEALHQISAAESPKIIDAEKGRFEICSKHGASAAREVFQLCVAKGWVLTELTPAQTSMEDIFRELTAGSKTELKSGEVSK